MGHLNPILPFDYAQGRMRDPIGLKLRYVSLTVLMGTVAGKVGAFACALAGRAAELLALRDSARAESVFALLFVGHAGSPSVLN
jgi:hypothetical protein